MKSVWAAVLALMLGVTSPAWAGTWVYFPIPGGALAFDEDSRDTDLESGAVAADVLTYYFVPRAAGPNSYNIRSERLVFDCRGNRHHAIAQGLFDDDKPVSMNGEPGAWTPTQLGTPPAVFQRALCTNTRPPTAAEAKDSTALRAALHALPVTGEHPMAPATQPKATKIQPAPSEAAKAGLR